MCIVASDGISVDELLARRSGVSLRGGRRERLRRVTSARAYGAKRRAGGGPGGGGGNGGGGGGSGGGGGRKQQQRW